MKKHLGIIKVENESSIGVNVRILTKFSDSKSCLEEWMKLYPNHEKIILDNNELLENFFKDFEDFTPVTEQEKKRAQKLYEKFMGQD